MTKKNISKMIDTVYRHCGQKETVIFCDRIMALGFGHACRAGISFGKDDMLIPEAKLKLVSDTEALAKEYEQQYNDGLITQGEKYNKVVDAWAKCSEKVADEMMARIKAVEFEDNGRQKPMNSIYMMSHSGARGSPTQMRQLAGMRGLMAKPSGEIIETPIISNFKEGLTVLEYFNSTHGARKGLADTALKTANSGYLTRRLVDVAQDCIVNSLDCGTEKGLTMQPIVDAGQVVSSLGARILGRTALDDVNHPVTGDLIVKAGTLMDERDIELIEKAGVQSLRIRSALTCEVRTERMRTSWVCAFSLASTSFSSIRWPDFKITFFVAGSLMSSAAVRPRMRCASETMIWPASTTACTLMPPSVPQSGTLMMQSCATSTRRRVR
jgi:DNA-directed RNA polymerase subunit beta'